MTTGEAVRISGRVSRVFHANRESGWMAGKMVDAEGREHSFAGSVFANQGDEIDVVGTWTTHPRFGKQIAVESGSAKLDDSPKGLERVLATDGRFEGIGPKRAKRIVEAVMELSEDGDVGATLAKYAPQIAERSGASLEVVKSAASAWSEKKEFFETVSVLAEQGWTNSQAAAIFERYGANGPRVVGDDPYVLVGKIARFGFRTVDVVARKLGFESDDPRRLVAGVAYCLDEFARDGNTYTIRTDLIERAIRELRPDSIHVENLIGNALDSLIERGIVHVDYDRQGKEIVASAHLAGVEFEVFRRLCAGLEDADVGRFDVDPAAVSGSTLNDGQSAALRGFASRRFSVVCGGAGVGKTHTMKAVCACAAGNGLRVELCAPTGKAARKLQHAVGGLTKHAARTIHRLLEPEFVDGEFRFTRGPRNPIEADVVIVDEVSMVDVNLMRSLLFALPEGCRLLMVGDDQQIPSVGAGAILRDVLSARESRFSESVHVLTDVVRQAGTLARNTNWILRGAIDAREEACWKIIGTERGNEVGASHEVVQEVERLVTKEDVDLFGRELVLDFDVQVLSPMRKGPLGTYELNAHLQRLRQRLLGHPIPELPPEDELGKKPVKPLQGDRIIWTKNDYELGLLNGTQAIVTKLPKGGAMEVFTDEGKEITIPAEKRKHAELAFAITMHKSQGSEWPAVVVVAASSHWRMHDRNLLYTGVSRASHSMTIVGDSVGMKHFAQEQRASTRRTFGSMLVHGWEPTKRNATSSGPVEQVHKSEAKEVEAESLPLDELPW